jgi:hypothetical protein
MISVVNALVLLKELTATFFKSTEREMAKLQNYSARLRPKIIAEDSS